MKTGYLIGGLFFVGVIFYLVTKAQTAKVVAANATGPSTSNALITGGFGLINSLINMGGKQTAPSASPYAPGTNGGAIIQPGPGEMAPNNPNLQPADWYPGNNTEDTTGSGVADGGT